MFWMDHVERKHISKALCHIPAFLNNPETHLECLDFPDPKLELPTAFGSSRGQWLDRQGLKREVEGWCVDGCRPGETAVYQTGLSLPDGQSIIKLAS